MQHQQKPPLKKKSIFDLKQRKIYNSSLIRQRPEGTDVNQKRCECMNIKEFLIRFSLADFFWSLDSDVFLTDLSVLSFLVNQNLTVVAPMLPSIGNV